MNRHERRASSKGAKQARADESIASCAPEKLISVAIGLDQAGHPGMAQIFREMAIGGFAAILNVQRDEKFTQAELGAANRPTLVVLGDDDYQSTGPDGWRCSATVASWAACAVIHASSANAETYQQAILAARTMGRCVLIETDSAHAEAWLDLFPTKPTLTILPTNGAHPAAPPKGSIH
jgi:hypothetical protein